MFTHPVEGESARAFEKLEKGQLELNEGTVSDRGYSLPEARLWAL